MAEGTVQIIEQQPPSVLEAMTRGEIDVQIATAHRFPRNLKRAVDEARSLATVTPEIAESMGYALPRAGKVIRGPSVRLAEVLGYTWGNLRYGARVVDIDDKFVTAQGVCHDLEKNVAATSEVKRRITDRAGRRYNDDMITVASNAACSIALRNAIFKVIPFALAQEVYAAAMKVAVGDMKSLAERRQRAMAYFTGTLGVEEQRVLAVLGRRSVEEITLDDLATLTGLKTAIKDGEISLESAFPPLTKSSVFTPEPGKGPPSQPGHQPMPEPPVTAPPRTGPESPQGAPQSPKVPQGDAPQGPPVAPQTPAHRPRQDKQVRRATHGPFQVPEDLREYMGGVTQVRTAGVFADTLWAIRRLARDDAGVAELVKSYLHSFNPPLSRRELEYLREEEGLELLGRIRSVLEPVTEPQEALGQEHTPTAEDSVPEPQEPEPAMGKTCEGFRVGQRVTTKLHGAHGTILAFQPATSDRGPTALVRLEDGDRAGEEIPFYVRELPEQGEPAEAPEAGPPAAPTETNGGAAGFVLCKGPHAGKRVPVVAVCAACAESGDCPELAQHRRQAAGELF